MTKELSLTIISCESLSSASGAKKRRVAISASGCCCWDWNAGPGRLCFYLSLNALPVVVRAPQTLYRPCHTDVPFLRLHLPPCWLCKHFRVPNPAGQPGKHTLSEKKHGGNWLESLRKGTSVTSKKQTSDISFFLGVGGTG